METMLKSREVTLMQKPIIPTLIPLWGESPKAGEATLVHEHYTIERSASIDFVFEDLDSFIQYCQTEMKPGKSIIFWDSDKICALQDRNRPEGNSARYNFNLSVELQSWMSLHSTSLLKFKKFLEPRLNELVDLSFFAILTNLKLNVAIKFEANMEDDRNYGFIFEQKDQKGSSKIPKEIVTLLPFFANDEPQEIVFRLSISQPKNQTDSPFIGLELFNYDHLRRQNILLYIERLKKGLSKYLILAGNSK